MKTEVLICQSVHEHRTVKSPPLKQTKKKKKKSATQKTFKSTKESRLGEKKAYSVNRIEAEEAESETVSEHRTENS